LGDLAPLSAFDSEVNDLPSVLSKTFSEDVPFVRARDIVMRMFRRQFIEAALARHGGNVPKAASAVNVSRRYFDRIRERSRGDDGSLIDDDSVDTL